MHGMYKPHVNCLNEPIKRQIMIEWIKKVTQLSAVYKKLTLNITIQVGWK